MPRKDSAQEQLDACLNFLCHRVSVLQTLALKSGLSNRAMVVRQLREGKSPQPRFHETPTGGLAGDAWHWLRKAREWAEQVPEGELYQGRLDELELECCLVDTLGQARLIRPLARRRYGSGQEDVPWEGATVRLLHLAERLLREEVGEPEARTIPSMGPGLSLESEIYGRAYEAGLTVEVEVLRGMAAAAVTSNRKVLVGDRDYGRNEAKRLAVHEVFGHCVAGENARSQPLRILELGTAESYSDQEGTALLLEEQAGFLRGYRLRTIAARVWVTDRLHQGATFAETALTLVRDHGIAPEDAAALCERAWRGGGIARDVGYLKGWIRVRNAVQQGEATLDELRTGRVSVQALNALRRLQQQNLANYPRYKTPPFQPPSPERPYLKLVRSS